MTTQKKTKVPWAAIAWGIAGAGLLVRAIRHPFRSVVRDGYASRCSGGSPCSESMGIESMRGVAPVYSVVPGRVLRVEGQRIVLASSNEPVVVFYSGDLQSMVVAGDAVGLGQTIAAGSSIQFAVSELVRQADGRVEEQVLEPAAWLAARGLSISAKSNVTDATGERWCEAGRKLVIPEQVRSSCEIRLPKPPGFALLPVSSTME